METVDYNLFHNNETFHPLLSVVDLSKAGSRQASDKYFGFYTIFLKKLNAVIFCMGGKNYDGHEEILFFMHPARW